MKKQKATDTLLQAPMWFFTAVMIFFAVVGVLHREWRLVLVFVVAASGAAAKIYSGRIEGARELDQDQKKIASLRGRPFDEVLAEIRSVAVAIPGVLADPSRFSPRTGIGRHFYFEWNEVVFRLEPDAEGKALIVLRDEGPRNIQAEGS